MNTPNKKQFFDDMAEEFENERAQSSRLSEHELERAIASMRVGKSPDHFSTDPEFQEALRLHVLTSNSEVNDDFATGLQQRILERAGAEKRMAAVERTPWYRHRFFVPFASAAGMAVVLFGVVAVMNSETGSEGAVEIAREASPANDSNGVENSGSENAANGGSDEINTGGSGGVTGESGAANKNNEDTSGENTTVSSPDDEATDETGTEQPTDSAVAVATIGTNDIELLLNDTESDAALLRTAQEELAEYDAAVAEVESDVQTVTAIASSL